MDRQTRLLVAKALHEAAATMLSATTEKRLQYVLPKLDDIQKMFIIKIVFNALGLETRVRYYPTFLQVDGINSSFEEALEKLSPELNKNSVVDSYIPWLASRVKKEDSDDWESRMISRFRAVCIWASENKVDIGKLTAEEALDQSEGYESKASQKAAQKEANDAANPVIYKFPDGWYVQELKTDEALKNEGDRMGHCVGGYCDVVKSGSTRVFSLRNPKGGSRVTLEYAKVTAKPFNGSWAFRQAYGRENACPPEGTEKYLIEFIKNKFDSEPNGLLLCGMNARDIDVKSKPVDWLELSLLSYEDGDPVGSFTGADLSGVDLSGVDLNGINFEGSKFDGAKLVETNFTATFLSRCSFIGADLRNADFTEAALNDADFRGAKLDDCDLSDVTGGRKNAKFDGVEQLFNARVSVDKGDLTSLLSEAESAGDDDLAGLCRKALDWDRLGYIPSQHYGIFSQSRNAYIEIWLLMGED